MRMMDLAFRNFKNGFKNYLSLVISLAFTILVLFNFQNIIYSGAFEVLGTRNKEYIDIIIQMISFILGCFMFFFIWYATNVFLTRRKKEIGIYVFMGLSNEQIGKMYLIETVLIGLSALFLGLIFGAFSAGLFQMVLFVISDVTVDIQFCPKLRPIIITAVIYLAIYLIFVIKGYAGIVRSSVLSMISAAKQNEYVRQNQLLLLIKTILGLGILCAGYYLAVKEGRSDVMANAFAAVVLVTIGVYLLFGGLLPFIFQTLARKKQFLYQKQRILWINNVIFRMKKNYRTYAMVCILMLCSVTALATGFAMRNRYDNIIQFENTYTFQLLGSHEDLDEPARKAIEKNNEIVLSSQIPILSLDSSYIRSGTYYNRYAILPYSRLKLLAEETGIEFTFEEPSDEETISISHLYLASLITERTNIKVDIGGKTYSQIDETTAPYLGYLQESIQFFVLNDREYERLRPMGEELYTFNYRVKNLELFSQTRDNLDSMIKELGDETIGRVAIDPASNELDWVKVLYSVCIFMFFVFILASGSIMFMKLYHDAFEERERYLVIMKMGVDQQILKKSISMELAAAYGATFVVMGISSCFSIGALGKMMYTNLGMVNVVSVIVVSIILLVWYFLSVKAFMRNAGIRK